MLAYIDPGTGSALVYVVTGVVVSIYFAVRGFYYRLIELAFHSRHQRQSCSLAMHCEDPRYESTFMPVVRELGKAGIEMTFFTMYPRDDSFERLPDCATHCEIPPGMLGYAHLNYLEANVLVTTTPQLDVMTFRRSRKVKHYSMLPHALGECRYVRPYAYDFFDSVMCCGEILKRNIRTMEQLRGLPEKRLFETGIPHYDELLRDVNAEPKALSNPLVLIAPSWGPQSIFQVFGTELVQQVAARYNVLVRPHPQMRVSQPELYEEILSLKGVTVDVSRTPADAMRRADILISDISGIMHEMAFIQEKPVLIVDHQLGMGGLEGELLGGDSELKNRCRAFIVPVPPEHMDTIADRIGGALRDYDRQRMLETRRASVYHFGQAGRVAAEQILEILSAP